MSDTTASPSKAKVYSHGLLNHPDIWGKLALGIIRELCGGHPAYTPVPKLKNAGKECLPLQVFTGGNSLTSGAILKLDCTQRRLILSAHDRKSGPLRSMLRLIGRGRRDVPSQEIHIREEVDSVTGPNCFQLQQAVRCFKTPLSEGSFQCGWRQTTFKLSINNVSTRKIDPRALLDCRISPASPVAAIKARKFYLVYETILAGKIVLRMHLRTQQTSEDDIVEVTQKDCPICFRFVEVRFNRQGVVTDLRFDVRREEIMDFDSHSVIPTMTIMLNKKKFYQSLFH